MLLLKTNYAIYSKDVLHAIMVNTLRSHVTGSHLASTTANHDTLITPKYVVWVTLFTIPKFYLQTWRHWSINHFKL